MSFLICPYCEQDWVWKVRHSNGAPLPFSYICFECDTTWENSPEDFNKTGLRIELRYPKDDLPKDIWNKLTKVEKTTQHIPEKSRP